MGASYTKRSQGQSSLFYLVPARYPVDQLHYNRKLRRDKCLMVPIGQILNDRTGFWRYAIMRFIHDKSIQRAAGLSYTTLLAMVPFLAVALTVLSAFPVFDQWKDQITGVVLNNFLPETGEQVTDYLGGFLQNTGQMTAIGTIVLALTAVMLLGAIEGAMNDVFRVTTPRKLLAKLVVFWTLLTVGPMLLGLSLSVASYIFAMRYMVGADGLGEHIGQLTFLAPFLLSSIAFSLLFIGVYLLAYTYSNIIIIS